MTAQQSRLAVLALATLASTACSGPGAVQPPAITTQNFHSAPTRPVAGTKGSFVYVADQQGEKVWIFPAYGADPNPVGSITQGISSPNGIAIDKAGTLYVANISNDSVTIYPAGQTSPSLTLTQDLTAPGAVAVDQKGNVWVSNELGSFQGSVVEFPAGSTQPSTVIPNLNPYGLAFDSAGNLYVANYNTTVAHISVYPPGKTKPALAFGGKNLIEPLGITIGPKGNVYVCDYQYNDVFIYAPHTYKLLRTVATEQGENSGVTLSNDGRLYTSNGSQAIVTEVGNDGFGNVLNAYYHTKLTSAAGVAADPMVPSGP